MIIRLSRDTRHHACKVIKRFNLLNAMAFALMADTSVFLLALHYGASDLLMGFLYAASFLSGLTVLPIPRLLKGCETSAIFRRCWFARSWVGMLYLLLPFFAGDHIRCWFLAGVFLVFMVLRSVGVTAVFTVYRSIASSAEMPGMMADIFSRVNLGQILMRSFAFLFLGGMLVTGASNTVDQATPWRLIALLGIGAGISLIAANQLRRLPATGTIDEGVTFLGCLRGVVDVLKLKETRPAGITSFVLAVLFVSLTYHVNYLRNVVVMKGAIIFLLQLIALAIGVPMNMLLKAIGPRIHLRTLLLAATALLVPACLIWCGLPATPGAIGLLWIVPLYLLLALPLAMVITLSLRLQSESLPKARNIELSVGYMVLSALGSLSAIGILAALGTLREITPALFPHPYTHAFALALFAAAALCFMARRMPDRHGKQAEYRDLLQLSPVNLLTLFRVHRVETNQKQENKHFALENLMRAPSWASHEILLENLRSPEFLRRYSAIRMIKAASDPAAYNTLIQMATDDMDPLQAEAITALGFLDKSEACPLLVPLLSNEASSVRAVTLKTLIRLEYQLPDETLMSVTLGLATFRQRLDVYIGLADMLLPDRLLQLMVEELRSHPPPIRSRVIFEMICVSMGKHDDFGEVFRSLTHDLDGAIETALDCAPEDVSWDRSVIRREIHNAHRSGDYTAAMAALRPYLKGAAAAELYDDTTLVGMTLIASLLCTDMEEQEPDDDPENPNREV